MVGFNLLLLLCLPAMLSFKRTRHAQHTQHSCSRHSAHCSAAARGRYFEVGPSIRVLTGSWQGGVLVGYTVDCLSYSLSVHSGWAGTDLGCGSPSRQLGGLEFQLQGFVARVRNGI
jgi:hypothetical protein